MLKFLLMLKEVVLKCDYWQYCAGFFLYDSLVAENPQVKLE